MQYDIDNPPVIVRSVRWKMLLLLVIFVGFVAIGLSMVRDDGYSAGSYFVIGFSAFGVVVALWRLFLPAWLEISPTGLRCFTGRKIEGYSWNDFGEFRIYRPSAFSRHVGYVLSPNSSKHGRASRFARNLAGVDGGFGGAWILETNALVDLLNRAKEKWGNT